MQQFEKDKFFKDLEEFKNVDLLQYNDCNIMNNKFHEISPNNRQNISYNILPKKKQHLRKNLGYLTQC